MDKIILFCNSAFPYGTAYSSRILHFSKLFKSMGLDVCVVAQTSKTACSFNSFNSFEGINYYVLGNNSFYFRYFSIYKKATSIIERLIKQNSSGKVYLFINGGNPILYRKILKVTENNNRVICIFESCEWYDVSSYKLRFLDYRYHLFQHYIKKEFIKNNRIIAISTFLEKYYTANNKNSIVVRIPTILDIDKIPFSLEPNEDKIRFMFAGSVGGDKELFLDFARALSRIDDKRVEFHLFGATKRELKKTIKSKSLWKCIDDKVFCHGYIKQEKIYEEYRKSDFSIIFRPLRRSSNAGFPTKLAESMACGTPVIANSTGDIEKYISNFQNGFIVDNNEDLIYELIQHITLLSKEDAISMRKKARQTAIEYFDYKRYFDYIRKVLK